MNTLKSEIFLPISLKEAWDFFSSPGNLNDITPDDMVFRITSPLPEKMYEGLIITYKVSPLLKIPLNWITEITHIKEPLYFIDEQLKGPYKLWHHEHHFAETPGGVKMTDIVYYDVGKYFLGPIIEKILVNRKVKHIFKYREEKLKQIFPLK